MNREILFRGWDPIEGKWIYGSGVHSTPFWTCLLTESGMLREVDPPSVGEWTGQETVNSVLGCQRIFEGDFVVRRDCLGRGYTGPFFVRFVDNGFVLRDKRDTWEAFVTMDSIVIGNETENPQLHSVENQMRSLEEVKELINRQEQEHDRK